MVRASRIPSNGHRSYLEGVFSTIPYDCTELILVATEKKIRYSFLLPT
jgi:hypothetical protein